MREIHDLVDGVNGFALAAAAAHIEDAGNELVLSAGGVGQRMKFDLPPGDKRRNANGLATMAADNRAKSFRDYRG